MLFKKATNAQAFLKMGIQGFAGDGKTHTASVVAIGLAQLLRERGFPAGDRPVMFLDSESGSDWVKPLFDAADIELEVAKTRAFVDLKDAVRETESRGCVLIADSLTHFWRRFCEEYAARKERRRGLEFQDWNWLKTEWGAFTDLYVNSQCHIVLAGRAGYEYDYFERDDGKKELERTGVKMKAESETAFEPSLLVHMEKHIGLPDAQTGQVQMWRTATVLKDRSRRIDGRVFINPTFADFRPHIECLNLGGAHLSVDLSRNNAALFQDDGKPRWQREKEMKEIALAEVADLLAKHFPGQAADQKRLKSDWLERAFNSRTWERIQTMDWCWRRPMGWMPPPDNGISVPEWKSHQPLEPEGASTMQITTIGLDLVKNVFQVHGSDEYGKVMLRKQLRRDQLLPFFANLTPCLIGMEACGGAHHWARKLQQLGHTVKLMAPQFVKPYVKSNNNDVADAEAICEAVTRPTMRFVPVKNVEQQAVLALHRVWQGFVKTRTAQVNQIRGLLAEFGLVVPQGISQISKRVPELLEDASNDLPGTFRMLIERLLDYLKELDRQIDELEDRIKVWHRSNEQSRRLEQIPGIGPLTASALAATVGDAKNFDNGRQMAAWLGLVPRQQSSGGKSKLLGISKRGDAYVRTLLIHGARSVIQSMSRKAEATGWLANVTARRNKNVAAVAQANKTARIVWALLAHDRRFDPSYMTKAA